MFWNNLKSNQSWKIFTKKSDIFAGIGAIHVWSALGWHDIRQRYRRSLLGPLWFTLTTLLMVGALGIVYSTLLKQPLGVYLPYLGIGMVVWQFINTTANEACLSLISYSHIIKQIRLPLTVHVCRMAWRNFVILLHNLPIVIILMVIFGNSITWRIVEVIPGLVAILLVAIFAGIVFGVLCARYRDVVPIVSSLFQIGFFVTPVMWKTEDLHGRAWLAEYNPLFHMIEIIRVPVLGGPLPLVSWCFVMFLLVLSFIVAYFIMVCCRDRVAYWL